MTESNISDSNMAEATENSTSISAPQSETTPATSAEDLRISTVEADIEAALNAASMTIETQDGDPQPDVSWDPDGPMLAEPVSVAQEDVDLSDLSDLRALARRLRPNEGTELDLAEDEAADEDDLLDPQQGVWNNPYLSSSATAKQHSFESEAGFQSEAGFEIDAEAFEDEEDEFEDTLIIPSPEAVLAQVEAAKANTADDPYLLEDDLDEDFDAELDLHDASVFAQAQKRADAIDKGLDFGDPDLGRGRERAQLKASRIGVDYASLTEEPSFYAASKSGSEDHPFYRPLTADSGRLNAARRAAERLEPKTDEQKSGSFLAKMFGKRVKEAEFDADQDLVFEKPAELRTNPEAAEKPGVARQFGATVGGLASSVNVTAFSSKIMAGSAAAGVMALAAIGIWSWQSSNSEVQYITASTSFEKIVPETPGGMVVPHRDMGILNGDEARPTAPSQDFIQALDQLEPLSLPELKAQMEASATQHEVDIDSLISSFEAPSLEAPSLDIGSQAVEAVEEAAAVEAPLVMPEIKAPEPEATPTADPLEALILNPDEFEGDDIMQLLLRETSATNQEIDALDLAPSPAKSHGSLNSALSAFLFESNWQAAMPTVEDVWVYPAIGETQLGQDEMAQDQMDRSLGKSQLGGSKLKASAAHLAKTAQTPRLLSSELEQDTGVEVAQLLSNGAGGIVAAPELMLAGGLDDEPAGDPGSQPGVPIEQQGVPDGPWIPAILPQEATQPFALQLASMGSPNSARRQYKKYVRRYSDLLGDMVLSVQTKNIGMKRFYRVQVGPFPNELTALDMCGMLKSRGHKSCFVPKR